MEYVNRLYIILHPNNALIASQLTPEQFAVHYTSGSSKQYKGKVIFALLDSAFRHPYFRIDEVMEQLAPHEDGRPKATKFISSYRVLEHVDLEAIQTLYLATQEGYCIEVAASDAELPQKDQRIRLYAEINPMRMLVLSDYDFLEFGRSITDPNNYKSAPAQFYTELDINIEELLQQYNQNPFRQSPVHSLHLSTLRDGYYELNRYTDKHTKGLCLDSSLDDISYKLIGRGFMFASQNQSRFFPMPPLREIEERNYKFWRAM